MYTTTRTILALTNLDNVFIHCLRVTFHQNKTK